MSHEAILTYCCMIAGEDVVIAINAVAEEARDDAWEVINDISVVCDGDKEEDEQPFYVGVTIAAGQEGGNQVYHVDGVIRQLQKAPWLRDQLFEEIVNDRLKTPDPTYQAFIDWLFLRLAHADSWGLRNVPSWG